MGPSRCLVRGSINIDEVYSLPHIVRPGETISSTDFSRKPGGKGANQAYAVAKAGGDVDFDGHVGPDGKWLVEYLESGGVGVKRLTTVENEVTGRAIIQSSSDGENSIVLHKGANFYQPPSSQSLDLSSYSHLLLQNEIPLPITLAHLSAGAEAGLTSVFNPSPMLSNQELASFPWSKLSWLIVNEGELTDLLIAFGRSSAAANGTTDTDSDLLSRAEGKLQELHSNKTFSPSTSVICTLGSAGIIYLQVGQDGKVVGKGHLPAGKLQKPVKDTTGAGDCFAGYFVAGLMAGLKLEDALKTCLTACAICVESAGAMESYASKEEVAKRMGSS